MHLIAKQILEEEKWIRLPDLIGTARTTLQDGEPLTASESYPGAMVQLNDVVLEKGMGRTRPDVIAQMREFSPWEAGPILIEVMVTNAITEERMQRIRQNNLPTLEIDIRQLGGKVSRSEYARLVVDEVAGKRWLYHPAEVLLSQRAAVTLSQQASERNREIEKCREQEAQQEKYRKFRRACNALSRRRLNAQRPAAIRASRTRITGSTAQFQRPTTPNGDPVAVLSGKMCCTTVRSAVPSVKRSLLRSGCAPSTMAIRSACCGVSGCRLV